MKNIMVIYRHYFSGELIKKALGFTQPEYLPLFAFVAYDFTSDKALFVKKYWNEKK